MNVSLFDLSPVKTAGSLPERGPVSVAGACAMTGCCGGGTGRCTTGCGIHKGCGGSCGGCSIRSGMGGISNPA